MSMMRVNCLTILERIAAQQALKEGSVAFSVDTLFLEALFFLSQSLGILEYLPERMQ